MGPRGKRPLFWAAYLIAAMHFGLDMARADLPDEWRLDIQGGWKGTVQVQAFGVDGHGDRAVRLRCDCRFDGGLLQRSSISLNMSPDELDPFEEIVALGFVAREDQPPTHIFPLTNLMDTQRIKAYEIANYHAAYNWPLSLPVDRLTSPDSWSATTAHLLRLIARKGHFLNDDDHRTLLQVLYVFAKKVAHHDDAALNDALEILHGLRRDNPDASQPIIHIGAIQFWDLVLRRPDQYDRKLDIAGAPPVLLDHAQRDIGLIIDVAQDKVLRPVQQLGETLYLRADDADIKPDDRARLLRLCVGIAGRMLAETAGIADESNVLPFEDMLEQVELAAKCGQSYLKPDDFEGATAHETFCAMHAPQTRSAAYLKQRVRRPLIWLEEAYGADWDDVFAGARGDGDALSGYGGAYLAWALTEGEDTESAKC